MQKVLLSFALLLAMPGAAHAFVGSYQKYYCSTGNPFSEGMSTAFSFQVFGDTEKKSDTVTGYFKSEAFRFTAKPSFNGKTNVSTWKSAAQGISVSVQVPGPYDGLQDVQWGEVKSGKSKKSLGCYPAR